MILGVFICFSIRIDKNINKLSDHLGAHLSANDSKNLQNLFKTYSLMDSKAKKAIPLKMPSEDGRVFSIYFANVIVSEGDQRVIKPMRYRIRPHGSSEEIPTKFNVFNARIDSLENCQTWIPLFMRNHGLIPFVSFYEWVGDQENPNGKPKLILFSPEEREIMWAPVLYDEWVSKDGKVQFKSFAIITDGPPEEILKMGHDRCPIFLSSEHIDDWLNPKGLSKKSVYEILSKKENVKFGYQWGA